MKTNALHHTYREALVITGCRINVREHGHKLRNPEHFAHHQGARGVRLEAVIFMS